MDAKELPAPFKLLVDEFTQAEIELRGDGLNGHANTYQHCRESMMLAWGEYARSPEFAALVANDARYRFLREQNANTESSGAWCITCCDFTDEEGPSRYWVGTDLDTALDTARKDTPCGKESGDADTRND
jgi:hypothetical protein